MHVMDLSCSWIELNYNDVLFVWKISIPLHRDSNLIHKSSDYKNLFMWLKPEQWKMSIWKINDWRIIYKYCLRLCRKVFIAQSNMEIEPFLHSIEHSLNWALPPSFSILRANKSNNHSLLIVLMFTFWQKASHRLNMFHSPVNCLNILTCT